MGFISDIFGGSGGGDDAAQAAITASQTEAEYMREALNYLKQREQIPQQFREGSLARLGGIYGLPGGTGSQEEMIQQAIQSPLYGAIMGGQQAGEDAILRNAAATGGLRSGNVQEALYDYNTQLQNKALLESYNQQLQGLQGMAMLPSQASNIAQYTGQIGTTLGQGQIAAAQAQQAGSQQGFGNLMGLGNLGLSAYSSGMFSDIGGMFSDRRLKKNIKHVGTVKGWKWYTWTWNIVAEKMGIKGECQGCMAEEVFAERPDAVVMKDLFMWVLYPRLGVFNGTAIS